MKSIVSTCVMLMLLVAVLSSCQKEILPVGNDRPLFEERMSGDDMDVDSEGDDDSSCDDGDTVVGDHNTDGTDDSDDGDDGINDGDGDDEDDEGGEQRGAN